MALSVLSSQQDRSKRVRLLEGSLQQQATVVAEKNVGDQFMFENETTELDL